MPTKNQFQLLTQRRYLPYFSLQFLGALNDNVFKTSLLMLIAMTLAPTDPNKANLLNNLGAAAFIFPFFLFSATAGQLADKYEKKKLVQIIKFGEILIALLIALGFYLESFPFLLFVLFLLGVQAAFFAPVKYSILPQYLEQSELTGGNGLVEMGTFVAILLGTIIGGLIISIEEWGSIAIPVVVFLIALFGWLFSLMIPNAKVKAQDPQLKINWEPISQTWRTLKEAATDRTLFWTMIGISWFWFYGSMLITQIPNYTRIFLGADAKVMTLMLTVASLGIGLGSVLCEPLSKRKEEIGLVPLGALGLTLFAADLSFAHGPAPSTIIGVHAFLQQWQNWRVLSDLFLIGLFGGFYSVPLYVMLQTRSMPEKRSQIIAANSILNALFMTAASFLAIGVLKLGLSIPKLFLLVALLNGAMTFCIYKQVPEFLIRFRLWIRGE